MLKTFAPLRLALFALCALSLFGLRAYGQVREAGRETVTENTVVYPNGIVQDWSHRHVG